ncbi:hypothetical protein C8R45DRAFT_946442 [Mycena sanguinolenta]|nr:hypothetical protein C8R45DRAFT_946442 [Mycena sanguinolenta]
MHKWQMRGGGDFNSLLCARRFWTFSSFEFNSYRSALFSNDFSYLESQKEVLRGVLGMAQALLDPIYAEFTLALFSCINGQYLESAGTGNFNQQQTCLYVLSRVLKKEGFILPTDPDPVSKKYDFSDMPGGLLAMSAAAVSHWLGNHRIEPKSIVKIERALKLYLETGARPEKLPKFRKASSGTSVTSYVKNIRCFTLTRWKGILAACGAQRVASTPLVPFAFDAYRDFIYTPSTP